MIPISITHFARNLADIVNRVAYRGERFTILRGNREVAEVIPAGRGRPLSELAGILSGAPGLGAEEAAAFAADVDAAREAAGIEERDPWTS